MLNRRLFNFIKFIKTFSVGPNHLLLSAFVRGHVLEICLQSKLVPCTEFSDSTITSYRINYDCYGKKHGRVYIVDSLCKLRISKNRLATGDVCSLFMEVRWVCMNYQLHIIISRYIYFCRNTFRTDSIRMYKEIIIVL